MTPHPPAGGQLRHIFLCVAGLTPQQIINVMLMPVADHRQRLGGLLPYYNREAA